MFEVDVKNVMKGREGEGGGPARVWGSDKGITIIFALADTSIK